MKPEKLLLELEALCEQTGYRVRKERGSFRGGHCVMEGDRIILINRRHPAEVQVRILASVLKTLDVEDLFIKPAVRQHLDEHWAAIQNQNDIETEESET